MHEGLQKAKIRQLVRRSHADLLNEEATLYSAFVQPFADVLGAVKLGTQDILNSASLLWDTAFTLSPRKLKDAKDKFDKRKGEIEKKWEPIMKRSKEALASGDADIVALAFAPGLTLGAYVGKGALEAAGGTLGYLEDAGWRVPLLGSLRGLEKSSDSDSAGSDDVDYKFAAAAGAAGAAAADAGKDKRSLLQKLAGLFYIESSWLVGDLIVENENQDTGKPRKSSDFVSEFNDWMEATGVLDEFKKTQEDLYESYKTLIDEIAGEPLLKLEYGQKLASAAKFQDFLRISEEAEAAGIEFEVGSSDLKQKIDKAAQEIVEEESFEETLEKTDGVKADDLSDDQKLEGAKKLAFLQMKKGFDDKLDASLSKLKVETIEAIEEQEPNSQTKNKLQKSKEGLRFLKLFDDAKKSINNAYKLSTGAD